MNEQNPRARLKTLDDIEKTSIPGLVEVLREEGVDAVKHVLWEMTSLHRDYSIPAWRNEATEERKRVGWEMAVRIEKILYTLLHEAYERQVEKTITTLSEGPVGFDRG